MVREFYTVDVIPHLENETGEYDYVPTFEVRIDKGGKEKSSTARRLRLEQPLIAIIEDIETISAFSCPYISDFAHRRFMPARYARRIPHPQAA